ncbi:hypothetical protein [Kurthia senegalensis]|nr:hypothetical protein [Kurthia senegalensis]
MMKVVRHVDVAGAHMKKIKNQEKVMTFFNKCAALFIFSMALYIAFNLFK